MGEKPITLTFRTERVGQSSLPRFYVFSFFFYVQLVSESLVRTSYGSFGDVSDDTEFSESERLAEWRLPYKVI